MMGSVLPVLPRRYHGWSFDGGGACTRIPQGGCDAANPRACATHFACEERQGLLFVWPQPLLRGGSGGGAPDPGTIITVPELEDPSWVPSDTFRDLPYDWSLLIENGESAWYACARQIWEGAGGSLKAPSLPLMPHPLHTHTHASPACSAGLLPCPLHAPQEHEQPQPAGRLRHRAAGAGVPCGVRRQLGDGAAGRDAGTAEH